MDRKSKDGLGRKHGRMCGRWGLGRLSGVHGRGAVKVGRREGGRRASLEMQECIFQGLQGGWSSEVTCKDLVPG